MINVQIRVDGLAAAQRRFDNAAQFRNTRRAVKSEGKRWQSVLRAYPAARHGPAIWSDDPEKRARQLRGFFARLRDGSITVPYVRTGRLQRGWVNHWSDSADYMQLELVNRVPYGTLVQGSGTQTRYHGLTGWRTDEQIVQSEWPETLTVVSLAVGLDTGV